jgi:hypothetical protein
LIFVAVAEAGALLELDARRREPGVAGAELEGAGAGDLQELGDLVDADVHLGRSAGGSCRAGPSLSGVSTLPVGNDGALGPAEEHRLGLVDLHGMGGKVWVLAA